MNVRIYQASFDLLQRDFESLLEYIEPADANAACYSHRAYALLLRACTEFESLARDLLVASGDRTPRADMNVNDYRRLEGTLHLERCEVDFLGWRPKPRRIAPYREWSTSQPPLAWYRSYNTVKHNRDAEFHLANLGTVVEALAALFTLTAKASDLEWPPCHWSLDKDGGSLWRGPFRLLDPSQLLPGSSAPANPAQPATP